MLDQGSQKHAAWSGGRCETNKSQKTWPKIRINIETRQEGVYDSKVPKEIRGDEGGGEVGWFDGTSSEDRAIELVVSHCEGEG